ISVHDFHEKAIAPPQDETSYETRKPSQHALIEAGIDVCEPTLKAWIVARRSIVVAAARRDEVIILRRDLEGALADWTGVLLPPKIDSFAFFRTLHGSDTAGCSAPSSIRERAMVLVPY